MGCKLNRFPPSLSEGLSVVVDTDSRTIQTTHVYQPAARADPLMPSPTLHSPHALSIKPPRLYQNLT
ncbi:uncharacterized protein BKA78DRAFT_318008 [Phyllosticta capitalensis]|uniref:uncharacterized protein n=1 Tax=Phyllosticta capitalensis TaxID=121624 RepID=UPI00312E51D8